MPISKGRPTVEEQDAARVQKTSDSSRSAADDRQAEARGRAMEKFHPDVVAFFRDSLGLELSSLGTQTLYDLAQGKLTEPLPLVVRPLAYDSSARTNVEMPKLKVFASVRAVLPMEDGRPVGLDADHRVHIATVPCRPLIERADVPEMEQDASTAAVEEGAQEYVKFSEAQLLALEGIGIDRSRMFGGYNHVSAAQKREMASGRTFYVDGSVKTSFGSVNVIGYARLGTDSASFESTVPEARESGKVIDILDARRCGALELDFFRRSPDGRTVTNVYGAPMLNRAGENVVTYGMAMEPVKGFIHRRVRDEKTGQFVEKVETGMYQVTAVNGNLFASKMNEEKERTPNGRDRVVGYTVAQAAVKDGKVYVNGKNGGPLEFASERDMRDYLAGRGGVVRNAVYHDARAGKDVTYDAFVVPDNTRGGFARQFTPETSRKLIERREQKRSAVKRQNFGMGL